MHGFHPFVFLVLAFVCVGGCVPLPAALSRPDAIAAASEADSGPVGLNSGRTGRLAARRVSTAPRLDGQLDAIWQAATPIRILLSSGRDGIATHDTLDVELRAVHAAGAIYFLAQWSGEPPSGAADTTFNQLTIHWTVPAVVGSPAPACAVACHTAYVDGRGQVAYMNSETIPQGGEDALSAAGGWAGGVWSVAWRRPLVGTSAYDLQFTDLSVPYQFFVKVFAHTDDRPDLVSEPYVLVFIP
jgi:hypothetical protein